MPFCSECGGKLNGKAKFCMSCGAKTGYYFSSTNQTKAVAAPVEAKVKKSSNKHERHDGLDHRAQYKVQSTRHQDSSKSYRANQVNQAPAVDLSQVDVSDKSLKAAWKKVNGRRDPTNWCVFGFEEKSAKVVALAHGSGGMVELRKKMATLDLAFGCLRVQGVDIRGGVESRRDKFVSFDYCGVVPENVRAVFQLSKDKVWRFWGSTALHLSLRDGDIKTKLTATSLGPQLLRAGAAHKPTHYDFGGQSVFEVTAIEEGSDDSSSEDFD